MNIRSSKLITLIMAGSAFAVASPGYPASHDPRVCATDFGLLDLSSPENFLRTAGPGEIDLKFTSKNSEKTHHLVGSLEPVEIVPGYKVLRLTENSGKSHWIDPEKISVQSFEQKPSNPSLEKRLPKNPPQDGIAVIEPEKFRDALCVSHLAQVPRTPSLEKAVQVLKRNLQTDTFGLAARRALLGCKWGINASTAAAFAFFYHRHESRLNQSPDWFSEHGSNLIEGIVGMTAVHQCLGQLRPSAQKALLGAALGSNLLGQVWEEINLFGDAQKSLPIFNSAGQVVQTDPKDFASGVAGILLYAAVSASFEKIHKFSLDRFCAGGYQWKRTPLTDFPQATFKGIKEGFQNYAKEAKEEGWATRLVLKNRKEPKKFDHSIWSDPLSVPFTLPSELFRFKKTPTLPSIIALSWYPVSAAFDSIQQNTENNLKKASQSLIGADYLLGLSQLGVVSLEEAAALLKRHKMALKDWNTDPTKTSQLPRMTELMHSGTIPSTETATTINRLAHEAFAQAQAEARKGPATASPGNRFEDILERHWRDQLNRSKDPTLAALPSKEILTTIFQPVVKLNFGSDVQATAALLDPKKRDTQPWAPYSGLIENYGEMQTLALIQASQKSPKAIAEKLARWNAHFPQTPAPPYLQRLELSEFSKKIILDGVDLPDESSRWEKIWMDPRFSEIKKDLATGALSQFEALKAFEIQAYLFHQVSLLDVLDPKQREARIREWVGLHASEQIEPDLGYFVSRNIEETKKQKALSPRDEESCRLGFGKLYVNFLRTLRTVKTETEAAQLQESFSLQLRERSHQCVTSPAE